MVKKKIFNYLLTKEFLASVAGDYAVDLVKICEKKRKPVTDEEIEKKLKIKITEIRATLNRLHYRGIANYQKKRNNKTGWYSYTWEINTDRIAELIVEKQIEELKRIEKKIEYEGTYSFFTCSKKCNNFPFEIGAEYHFRCPECGNKMQAINNKKNIKNLEKQKLVIEADVEELKKFLN